MAIQIDGHRQRRDMAGMHFDPDVERGRVSAQALRADPQTG